MNASVIIPPDSPLYQALQKMAQQQRMVMFAGLPGVGKSLLLQQFSLLAHEAGREVHLLQYDMARAAFETPEILARYPEVDGVTHAAIRKAVGMWARTAVAQWHTEFHQPQHILIGEVPLIGNRLMELAQVHHDAVEPLLSSEQTCFVIPAPSSRVRQIIEAARTKSMAQPQHEKDMRDAPPHVLRELGQDIARLGYKLGLVATEPVGEVAYDAGVYTAVYQHCLQHRHTRTFIIDTVLPTQGSVYELGVIGSELMANEQEVAEILAEIERRYTREELATAVANWFAITV
jgi:hypothetical protein